MNRRVFFGVAAQVSSAFAIAFLGRSTVSANTGGGRTPSSDLTGPYGVYGIYNSYGSYGAHGGYGPYGSYGSYGAYGTYGVYGVFGQYGPYGLYGVYGINNLNNSPSGRAPGSEPQKVKDKKGNSSSRIDFDSLTNRNS